MPSTITPNMSLTLPTVGQQLAPDWAENINNDLLLLDQHNHTPGSGVPITPSAISIDSDLSLQGFNLIGVRSVRMVPNGSPLAQPSDLSCVYVSGVDLYYNDSLGNQVRITQSGAVAGTPGSIANLVSPASATYVSFTPAFVFQSNTNTSANLDGGSLTIRQNIPAANGITISSPGALASNYALTLFNSLPVSNLAVLLNSSGNLTTGLLTGSQIASGITLAGDVTTGGSLTTTTTLKIGSVGPTITGATGTLDLGSTLLLFNTASNAAINPSGTATKLYIRKGGTANDRPIVVSADPTSAGLVIVRGIVNSAGTKIGGEGFTSSRTGAGLYTITFTAGTFSDTPSFSAIATTTGYSINLESDSTATVTLRTFVSASTLDSGFSFIAVGARSN